LDIYLSQSIVIQPWHCQVRGSYGTYFAQLKHGMLLHQFGHQMVKVLAQSGFEFFGLFASLLK